LQKYGRQFKINYAGINGNVTIAGKSIFCFESLLRSCDTFWLHDLRRLRTVRIDIWWFITRQDPTKEKKRERERERKSHCSLKVHATLN